MSSFPILSAIIMLPLFGALISSLVKGHDKEVSKNIRDLALLISVSEFFLVLLLVYQYDTTSKDFQFLEKAILLDKFSISYSLGVDAISIIFMLLSNFVFKFFVFF